MSLTQYQVSKGLVAEPIQASIKTNSTSNLNDQGRNLQEAASMPTLALPNFFIWVKKKGIFSMRFLDLKFKLFLAKSS